MSESNADTPFVLFFGGEHKIVTTGTGKISYCKRRNSNRKKRTELALEESLRGDLFEQGGHEGCLPASAGSDKKPVILGGGSSAGGEK
jgi:hypothetical protein